MSHSELISAAIRNAIVAGDGLADTPAAANLRVALLRGLELAAAVDRLGASPVVSTLRGAVGASLMVEDVIDERLSHAIGEAIRAALSDPRRSSSYARAEATRARMTDDVLHASHDRLQLRRCLDHTWSGPEMLDAPEAEPVRETAVEADTVDAPPETLREPPPLTPVRLGEGGEPIPLPAFYRQIVGDCLDSLAMFGRERASGAFDQVPRIEARALRRLDAIGACNSKVLDDIVMWWSAARASPDPFKAWAAILALGSVDAPCAPGAIEAVLASIAVDDLARCRAAVDALYLAPNPATGPFLDELFEHPHPIVRAAAIETSALRGQLPLDQLEDFLLDGFPVVAIAALRAARGGSWTPGVAGWVRRLLSHPSRDVAWEATLSLSLSGDPEAWFEWRRRRRLFTVLADRGAELLVLFGDISDAPLLEELLRCRPCTATSVSCLARFGHAGAWRYLLDALADEEVASEAAASLQTLFGALVDDTDAMNPEAWRAAIASAKLDPSKRYRGGAPFRPSLVAAECSSGRLSRDALGARLLELAIRTGTPAHRALHGWFAMACDSLNSGLGAARTAESVWVPGAWSCRTAGG